jgi:hypothetical protein
MNAQGPLAVVLRTSPVAERCAAAVEAWWIPFSRFAQLFSIFSDNERHLYKGLKFE